MRQTAEQLAPTTGVSTACRVLSVPRSSLYRARRPKAAAKPRPKPSRALSDQERAEVRAVLNSDRFQDCPPRQVYATLLDEETYLCHWRTMYRILKAHNEIHERRNQLRHPRYAKPELVATGPNQLWSWDTLAPALQVQVSPSLKAQPSGITTTCTSSWTSSAVIPSAGCWLSKSRLH